MGATTITVTPHKHASCVFTLAALGCLFSFAARANADLVMTYAGSPFTLTDAGPGSVTASFVLSTPLIEGSIVTLGDVASWTMSAAGRTITSSTATFAEAEFVIGPSLTPLTWAFVAELDIEGTSAPESIISIQGPESLFGSATTGSAPTADWFHLDEARPNSTFAWGVGVVSSGSISPGTWTTSVPEPSPMLYGGMISAVLASGAWVKRRFFLRR